MLFRSPGQARRGLRVDEVAFATLLAHAEKRAAKLARTAGAKGRKMRETAVTDSINGSLTSLLKKSRVVARKNAAAKTGTQTARRSAASREVTASRDAKQAAR